MSIATFLNSASSVLTYKPQNMSTRQIHQESGGEHTWTSGKRKGQVKVSEAGAVGIAQVMPETAKETARKHKIPWDENKYRNDPNYNLQLGDLYQGDLDREFGKGTPQAKAAYHQGPGTVRKALRLAAKNGTDWRTHIGPKGQQYIGFRGKPGTRAANMGNTSGNPQTDFVASIEATLRGNNAVGAPPEGESKRYESEDPSTLTIASGMDTQGIRSDLGRHKDLSQRFLDSVVSSIEPLKAKSAQVVQERQSQAQTKHNLANDMQERAAALENRMIPLQQKRQALADRLTELDALSPFERRLKSAFNSDYDPRALRGRMERIDQQINVLGESYNELTTLRTGVAAAAVDADQADLAVLDAESNNIAAESRLIHGALSAVAGNIESAMLPLSMQTRALALTTSAKNSVLGQASVEQTAQWEVQARDSADGTIVIDGMTFTYGELQDAARQKHSQQLSFAALSASRIAGDIHLTQTLEEDALGKMTADELDAAIQAGGMFKGHQFSLDRLGAALTQRKAGDQTNVQAALLETLPGQIDAAKTNLADNFRAYDVRVKEMFGTTPGELKILGADVQRRMAAYAEGLQGARARGVENEYLATQLPMFQQIQQQLDSGIDALANRWGNGNKNLVGVAQAYLRGQPLNGDAATKGLVAIARAGGLPNGASLKGPAAVALQRATAIVRQFDNPAANSQPGTALDQLFAGASKEEKEKEMERRVQAVIGEVYSDGLTTTIFNELPGIARQIRDETAPGKIHPFARVPADTFRTAVQHGDQTGYESVGNQLGLAPNQVKQMINGGVSGALWQNLKKEKKWGDEQFNDLLETVQAAQMVGTLQALDAYKTGDGFSPARAFVDLLQNPATRARIRQIGQSYSQSGFGAFVVSQAAGGGFSDAWDSYADTISQSYTQLHSTNLNTVIKQQNRLMSDPYAKTNAVLTAMNLNKDERQLLLGAVRQVGGASDPRFVGGGTGQVGGYINKGPNFDKITYLMRNHKFEDPAVERLRMRVSKGWDEMTAVVNSMVDSLED